MIPVVILEDYILTSQGSRSDVATWEAPLGQWLVGTQPGGSLKDRWSALPTEMLTQVVCSRAQEFALISKAPQMLLMLTQGWNSLDLPMPSLYTFHLRPIFQNSRELFHSTCATFGDLTGNKRETRNPACLVVVSVVPSKQPAD